MNFKEDSSSTFSREASQEIPGPGLISMEKDRLAGSSEIRIAAIVSEIKKIVDDEDISSALSKSIVDKFQLNELPKFEYGFKDSKNYSRKTQSWQGFVTDVNDEEFVAKLEDLNSPGDTFEMGTFPIDDVSPGDLPLLQVGSIFYWSIGSTWVNGQIEKKSILRFKRVATWTEDEYNAAVDRAESLNRDITWE